MAVIEFACPECGKQIKAPEHLAGKRARCPGCQAPVTIQAAEADAGVGDTGVEVEQEFEGDVVADEHEEHDHPAEPEPELKSAPLALPAAVGSAVVGALIWGMLTYTTGYEIGYVAWGIGLLVGGGCVFVGGRGQNMAIACAALSLAGILLGKVLAVNFVVSKEIDSLTEQFMTQEAYAELQIDAADFENLSASPSRDEIRAFMVSHNFAEAEDPGAVAEEDVTAFLESNAPALRSFAAAQPTFEEWREGFSEAVMAEFSLIETIQEDLNAIDLLFAFLGVSTAYGLVMRSTRTPPTPVARRRRRR